MVSAVGLEHRHLPTQARPPAGPNERFRGNSAESVGQLAKQQLAEQTDLPANAMGKAAALIAEVDLSGRPDSTGLWSSS